MRFEFFVSSAAVTAIASLVSALLSAWIAKKTAESTANKEIVKMKLSWEREDIVSSDEEFAEMVKAVAKVCDFYCLDNQQDAIGKVASIRSKEYGQLGDVLDDLYAAVKSENFDAANMYLTSAINQKRELKSSCFDDSKV